MAFPRTLGLILLLAAPAVSAAVIGEVRGYPTGEIASLGWQQPQGTRGHVGLAASYNHAERGDAGRHDDEHGDGIGAGAWLDYQPALLPEAFSLGGRVEVYRLDLDWQTGSRRGKSQVTVLLPTATLGYRLPLGSARWQWTATASAGAEINLETRGEKVGEGAIGLLGLRLAWRP